MKKQVVAAAVFILAASSSAWADWGCAFSTSKYPVGGRRWGFATEKEARESAMQGCKSLKHENCRIVGCSANVDSKEDADKLWATVPGVKYNRCGAKGQPKC